MCSLGTGLLTVIQLYSPYQHSHVDDDVEKEGEHYGTKSLHQNEKKTNYDEKMDLKMRYKVCVSENTVSPSQGSPVSSYLDKHILPQNIILGTFCIRC